MMCYDIFSISVTANEELMLNLLMSPVGVHGDDNYN